MISECFNPDYDGPDCRRKRSIGHHLWWPSNEYTTPLEKAFRCLPENILQICECAEKELHREMFPPKKPSIEQMIVALTVQLDEVPEIYGIKNE